MKDKNKLTVGAIYNSKYGVIRYDGNGSTSAINARSGDPRIITCGLVDVELLESMTPSEVSPEEFNQKRRESTLAVSEFYEFAGIEA